MPSPKHSTLRILLAEDNAVNQKVALFMLDKLGHGADVVVNGQEAVKAAAAATVPYDIVLMDCQMPEMDGYDATRAIREQAGPAAPFIIAMTANAMEGDRQKCIDAGMDDYVSKPVKMADLKIALEHGIQKKGVTNEPVKAPPVNPDPVDLVYMHNMTDNDEAGFRYLAQIYLDETAHEIELITHALQSKDFEELRRRAHGCAGASATYGVTSLIEPLRAIEKLAQAKRGDEIAPLMELVKQTFAHVNEFLAPHLSKPR